MSLFVDRIGRVKGAWVVGTGTSKWWETILPGRSVRESGDHETSSLFFTPGDQEAQRREGTYPKSCRKFGPEVGLEPRALLGVHSSIRFSSQTLALS